MATRDIVRGMESAGASIAGAIVSGKARTLAHEDKKYWERQGEKRVEARRVQRNADALSNATAVEQMRRDFAEQDRKRIKLENQDAEVKRISVTESSARRAMIEQYPGEFGEDVGIFREMLKRHETAVIRGDINAVKEIMGSDEMGKFKVLSDRFTIKRNKLQATMTREKHAKDMSKGDGKFIDWQKQIQAQDVITIDGNLLSAPVAIKELDDLRKISNDTITDAQVARRSVLEKAVTDYRNWHLQRPMSGVLYQNREQQDVLSKDEDGSKIYGGGLLIPGPGENLPEGFEFPEQSNETFDMSAASPGKYVAPPTPPRANEYLVNRLLGTPGKEKKETSVRDPHMIRDMLKGLQQSGTGEDLAHSLPNRLYQANRLAQGLSEMGSSIKAFPGEAKEVGSRIKSRIWADKALPGDVEKTSARSKEVDLVQGVVLNANVVSGTHATYNTGKQVETTARYLYKAMNEEEHDTFYDAKDKQLVDTIVSQFGTPTDAKEMELALHALMPKKKGAYLKYRDSVYGKPQTASEDSSKTANAIVRAKKKGSK